jgi:hypothetical protein
MTEAELSAIEARLKAASPGPWRWWDTNESGGGYWGDLVEEWGPGKPLGNGRKDRTWFLSHLDDQYEFDAAVLELDKFTGLKTENADFLAHSWEDVRDLVAEVRRLRALLGLRG